MAGKRRSREELGESLAAQVNALRDTADEMARMFDGCDDPTHPYRLGVFRDWIDFVDRVAVPLTEAEDNETEQAAMRLYRQASPSFICAALFMAHARARDWETRHNQLAESIAAEAELTGGDECHYTGTDTRKILLALVDVDTDHTGDDTDGD